jgi:glycosyltransferase involved in cell wall biosynthesis
VKKVLVISYHFPPSGGSKTRRLLKFLKYLPQFRWMPIVLTTSGGTGFGFDPSLVDIIPREILIHRAFDLSSVFKSILGISGQERSVSTEQRRQRLRISTGRIWRKVVDWVKQWTAIPDAFLLMWAPFATCVGFRAIAREETDVIYSTGPPFSNHIVGMCLKRITGKPLILDFRDAWSANPVRRIKFAGTRHVIENILEKLVIRSADLVVSTTEGITEDFRRRYGPQPAGRFITLPNGYDRDEFCFPNSLSKEQRQKMRIVHTGQLTVERSPRPLLIALRQLLDERPDLTDYIEVYLVGENQTFLDGKTIENYLEEFRLHSVIRLVGHVPQPEAIQYQVSADILLLVIGAVSPEEVSTYGIASKVFDYMIAGRPVLALADPGPVSDLVQETQIGPSFAQSDIVGIKQYLAHAVDAFKQGRLEVRSNKEEIQKYDFRNITSQLVERLQSFGKNNEANPGR